LDLPSPGLAIRCLITPPPKSASIWPFSARNTAPNSAAADIFSFRANLPNHAFLKTFKATSHRFYVSHFVLYTYLEPGAWIDEVNAKDLRDVFHLMAVLEADAAGTVASTATAAQLLALEALQQQLEKAARDRKDHLRFFQLNEAFHVKLLEIANNRWAGQMVADLRKVMKLNRAQSLLKAGRIEESLAEHAAIMAALTSRDDAAAQAAMRVHIESGQDAAG
jgi:FCD domain